MNLFNLTQLTPVTRRNKKTLPLAYPIQTKTIEIPE
jgi:hypothetical protein